MKNNYIIIALLLVVAHFNVNAQLSLTHTSKKKGLSINEFDLEEDPIWFINALEAENVCDCSENISFNYDSFITSAFLMERAMKAARKEWLSRQENLVNEEIEKAFNTDFPNYREARKRLLKHQESTIVDHTIVGVKDKYITKRNQKRNYQETLLKEIKLLNFREEELRRGVISSRYGHLKLGAIPIKDLNLNAVLNEKRNRLSAFTTNNIALKKEGNIANELAKINNLPSGELNHGIFELLYAKQNEYFSKYNDWEQLNLTYVYLLNFLHPTRGPEIPNSITVNGKVLYQQFFGRADFLEHLAINNYGGNVSADNVSALLETISIDDMLADTAVKNLGQRNVDFLKSRPKLLSEIREYFKVNDFSKISHDCVNYLLNQLQDGNSFAPNTNLYQSSGAALLQNVSNPNRALSFNLNDQAIREGFTNFGNVLSELFADGENVGYEGYIIRNIFIKNGIYIPSFVIDTWLGAGFNFENNPNGKIIRINYDNQNGAFLLSNNISTSKYFNNLIQNINNRLGLDNRNKQYLFANPRIAFEYDKYLDNNTSTNSKLLLKEFEKVFLADCYGYSPNLMGLSGIRLYFYYETEKANLKTQHPDWSDRQIRNEVLLNMFQTGLDVIGLIPAIGEISDLTNGVIYFVRGDNTNAALSFSATVPFAGWAATGAKLAIKATVVKGGSVVTAALPFIFRSNGLIDFGSRGALKKVINTLAGEEAHHILPWAKRFNEVIQKAANAGFHVNDAVNGIALKKFRKLIGEGLHGNHPKYDKFVEFRLQEFKNSFPNATPQQAKEFLENNLIPELLQWIQKAKDLNTHSLNEYFKQVVNPLFGI
ncbi:AHH domain-containing protein [Tenacibaculum maritimum]|uniref:AHH domain-containing protein n=1 Tax=Tenacibaculum maritimum TaxID=107401 RepID=UPI0012E601AF|nr:AHH domain-containing protein [Tenacibaculum maritimum]CAA0225121.1 exported hypothetical protein [Tenacibaculum maritimum]